MLRTTTRAIFPSRIRISRSTIVTQWQYFHPQRAPHYHPRCDRGLEPPMQSTEKHPQPFQRVRQHQPGQVFLCEWATNPNTQPFLAPFKIQLWYRPVSTSPDDRFNDLILRSSGELEECLEVDGGPVLTED